MTRILVTGARGLIGRALCRALEADGCTVTRYDLLDGRDVLDVATLSRAMRGCGGVVHLAALARVVWCERDPDACTRTNVLGTRTVARAVRASPARPWLLFASSREVYGHATTLPVREDADLRPVNCYGRAKVAGETLLGDLRHAGGRTAIVRLSNVYGDVLDHEDRVVPAFARAAAQGGVLVVEGQDSGFDFVHVDDAVRGLVLVTRALTAGERGLPPVHLVTGTMTRLLRLADMAIKLAGAGRVKRRPPRTFDVSWFQGDPGRAYGLLGWTAQVQLRAGLARLIQDFQGAGAAARVSA